jgi:uncharacterized protein Yka (UPF0111/DUF47 family)
MNPPMLRVTATPRAATRSSALVREPSAPALSLTWILGQGLPAQALHSARPCAQPPRAAQRSPRRHDQEESAMPRLSQVFVPREREFFDLFEEAATNIVRAADLLDQMLASYPEHAELARDILVCEQEGDRITHDIIQRLNQTFVTPIDREDILQLASALDDIVDYTEEVADYLGLYKIEAPMEQAQRQAHILLQATRQISQAMPRLRSFRDISHYTVEINRLENDGDRTTREAIASLFDGGIDPMVVIRWKDLFERLEEAIDATEHVANILEGIVIKNA